MDRDELLQREADAWAGLEAAVARVSAERRTVEGVVPGWSVQDLVWHCGCWAGFVADVLEKIGRGESTGEDQDWDALNAMVIEDGRGMSWDEIIVASEQNRVRVRQALQALPALTEEAVTEFTGETFEHYNEHAAEIRAFTGA